MKIVNLKSSRRLSEFNPGDVVKIDGTEYTVLKPECASNYVPVMNKSYHYFSFPNTTRVSDDMYPTKKVQNVPFSNYIRYDGDVWRIDPMSENPTVRLWSVTDPFRQLTVFWDTIVEVLPSPELVFPT